MLPYIGSTIHGTRSFRLLTEYISLEASRLGKHERKERLICNDWIIRQGKHTVDIILGGSLMAAEFFVYLTFLHQPDVSQYVSELGSFEPGHLEGPFVLAHLLECIFSEGMGSFSGIRIHIEMFLKIDKRRVWIAWFFL